MYESLIMARLQFGIENWNFVWNRIPKVQKQALRIMTNNKCNYHEKPLFRRLEVLGVSDIFDV